MTLNWYLYIIFDTKNIVKIINWDDFKYLIIELSKIGILYTVRYDKSLIKLFIII